VVKCVSLAVPRYWIVPDHSVWAKLHRREDGSEYIEYSDNQAVVGFFFPQSVIDGKPRSAPQHPAFTAIIGCIDHALAWQKLHA
jgi:hypothetical protein